METKINMSFNFSGIKELREAEEIYNNCFNIEDFGETKYPSLKYTFCCINLRDEFIERLNNIKNDIKHTRKKLANYNGTKINAKLENDKLEENINKLVSIEKKVDEENEYFCDYLVTIAKRSDILRTELAKNIYIKISEDIINSQIKTLIKYEKSFLIIKDDLNRLKEYL